MVPAAAMADMGVELKLFATRSVEDLLGDASGKESGGTGRAARLEESIKSLEEEKRKIEAFKRELPLCVHLLSDVIEELHREIERCRFERSSRGFEEFIPIKSCEVAEDTVGEAGTDCKEKMNWMSSALLWSDNYGANNDRVKKHNESNAEENFEVGHGKANLLRECEGRNGRGALVPFKDLSTFAASCKEEEKPDLSLQSPAINNTLGLFSSGCGSKAATKIPDLSPVNSAAHLSLNQSSRKARRCWSQELHRRFVLAIQQLGGAQVATPKQIREHMKVDGLTNDEVKSHLQKYRMHSLRVSNTLARQSRSVGVLGGLWVPQEQYTTSSSQQSVSQSASPQSPFQLASSTCALSVTAGDVSEEEGKSESFSWN